MVRGRSGIRAVFRITVGAEFRVKEGFTEGIRQLQ